MRIRLPSTFMLTTTIVTSATTFTLFHCIRRISGSSSSFVNESSTTAAFVVINDRGSIVTPTNIDSRGLQQQQQNYRMQSTTASNKMMTTDPEYPGTAVQRLNSVHARIQKLVTEKSLENKQWEEIRRQLLWAGGLKDLPNARPGQGYTGHSFNDYNHVDLTCMLEEIADNENDGTVKGIAIGNRLGNGIRIASIPELGPGGSWSTCALGCNAVPPSDVAHIQFRSRIAFKLVWVPNSNYDTFVLVDDDGNHLATVKPTSSIGLPPVRERKMNYQLVRGSKYALVADQVAASETAPTPTTE